MDRINRDVLDMLLGQILKDPNVNLSRFEKELRKYRYIAEKTDMKSRTQNERSNSFNQYLTPIVEKYKDQLHLEPSYAEKMANMWGSMWK